jgi:hypothetical protein
LMSSMRTARDEAVPNRLDLDLYGTNLIYIYEALRCLIHAALPSTQAARKLAAGARMQWTFTFVRCSHAHELSRYDYEHYIGNHLPNFGSNFGRDPQPKSAWNPFRSASPAIISFCQTLFNFLRPWFRPPV